jgi:predicted metal-dependent peptidase
MQLFPGFQGAEPFDHKKFLKTGLSACSRLSRDKIKSILKEAKWKPSSHSDSTPFLFSVRANKAGRIVVQYDPVLVGQLFAANKTWFESIVLHEVLHITLGHLTYRLPHGVDRRKWNIACDLAINSVLVEKGKEPENLPPFILCPGRGSYEKFPHNKIAEDYYGLIKDAVLPNDEEHKLNNRMHQKREKIFIETTKREFDDAKEKLFHNITDNMFREHISYICLPGQDNQKTGRIPSLANLLLRITHMKATDFTSSRRVRNKRYPEYPGKKVERTPEPIVVMVDWSRSISDGNLLVVDKFIREINKMFPLVYVPFTTDALWEHKTEYGTEKFKHSCRALAGDTDIDKSLKAVYLKYKAQDQIIIIVSDFGADPVQEVRKNVFGVNTFNLDHNANSHKKLNGKMYSLS